MDKVQQDLQKRLDAVQAQLLQSKADNARLREENNALCARCGITPTVRCGVCFMLFSSLTLTVFLGITQCGIRGPCCHSPTSSPPHTPIPHTPTHSNNRLRGMWMQPPPQKSLCCALPSAPVPPPTRANVVLKLTKSNHWCTNQQQQQHPSIALIPAARQNKQKQHLQHHQLSLCEVRSTVALLAHWCCCSIA